MGVTYPPTCFEFHWYVYSFLSVVLAVNKLSIEKQIDFALEPKYAAAYHDFWLYYLLYFEGQFAVDLDSQRDMVDYMVLIEFSDIV